MKLYLIRHGIAVEPTEHLPDADRPLTVRGQEKIKAIAGQLRALHLKFDRLLASPLLRAQETASLLQHQNLTKYVEPWDGLSPGQPLQGWLTWYASERSDTLQHLALVGHEPDLSTWANQLLWGIPGESDRCESPLQLKKAGIIGVEIPDNIPAKELPGKTQLFWLMAPRFFGVD